MPSTLVEDEGGWLWRRKARSLDLGGSSTERSKAAASRMWHMHMSTTVKNESQYAQWQANDACREGKRRSSSFDHKDSPFRQEAVNVTSSPPLDLILIKGTSQLPSSSSVWDCGSKLYDTFELVSFSHRLDRSLLAGVPAFDAPDFQHAQTPLHHASVLRTLSLPRTLALHISSSASATPPHNNFEMAASFGNASVHGSVGATTNDAPWSNAQGLVAATNSKSSCANSHTYFTKWLGKFVKKVVGFHGQILCFKPFLEGIDENIVEPSASVLNGDEGGGMPEQEQRERYRVYEEKVKEGHKQFHHHHHHYHHHFLHHLDQSTRDAEPCNYKPSTILSPQAESAPQQY